MRLANLLTLPKCPVCSISSTTSISDGGPVVTISLPVGRGLRRLHLPSSPSRTQAAGSKSQDLDLTRSVKDGGFSQTEAEGYRTVQECEAMLRAKDA